MKGCKKHNYWVNEKRGLRHPSQPVILIKLNGENLTIKIIKGYKNNFITFTGQEGWRSPRSLKSMLSWLNGY
jgi:hypothetical protein